jgi:CDP-diacylglycerol--serine O-phosphatidyltransferase
MKHIPNAITCCNLICGCVAAGFAFQGNYALALAFIIAGAVFDFFDGFAARLLRVSSPMGKELDSLADDITFGLAPATIVYSLLRETAVPMPCACLDALVPYAAFLIAAFSALRLAKFNIDERQATTFYGLPTPANALFWSALAYGAHDWLLAFPHTFWLLLVGILFSCYILVADVPMFALKFKSFGWSGNGLRYSFIVLAAALLLLLGWSGFSVVIVLYILLSLIAWRVKA